MGLDVKDIQVSIRGFLELSHSLIKKFPVVSGVLLFFFLLYMFLPSVFTFFVFFAPVLLFITVAVRFIFRFHQQNLEKAIGENRNVGISARKSTSFQDDLLENSSTQPQSVRRRNAREKDKRVSAREGVEEKDMVFSAISNDDLVDKAALIEENPKEIREVNVDSVIDCVESSSAASQRARHEFGDPSDDYDGRELDADSSDDEEEEAQEDGNKAVEWTEDDQKNLMDLGLSEMERNKRLESLIARRKARKLLSMQVRRTLMNTGSTNPCGQFASVLIPRHNPCELQVSPTPGSAPSVLLPTHNPFDLPYDPQEEKPNLTGGSFVEEFMATTSQKDMMFCRHESFSLGAFFPGPGEFDQSRRGNFYNPNLATRPMAPEIPDHSRFRNQSGKEDPSPKLIQTESSLECKPMLHINSSNDDAIQEVQASERVSNLVDIHDKEDTKVVHKESNLVRDAVSGGSSSSSSSDVNVPFSAANKEEILKSLSFSVPKSIAVDVEYNGRRNAPLCDGSPSSFRNKIPEERFFFPDKVVRHTPTHSIASDMQVEVSERSSDLSVDGTISPSDGGSLSYEADLDGEKEANFGSEEMWVASSQLSRVEENESRSREVHEVSEQDIIEVGFSRMNKETEDIIASNVVPEKVVEEDSIDAVVSFPNIESPERSQTHLINFDYNVHDEVPLPNTACASDALSTENLALTCENALQSSKKSAAHPSQENNFGELEDTKQEQSDSPDISSGEVNIVRDTNDEVVLVNDDTEILEFIKNTYGEAPVLIKREAREGLSTLTMEKDVKPLEITEGYSGVPEHDNSNPTVFLEGEYRRQSLLISNLNGNENIQYRRDEPVVIDVESSGSNHSSNDTTAAAMQPETVAEQGPSDSSSSSSSSSMTQEKFPISDLSRTNFEQTTQIEVRQSALEVVDDNFADRLFPDSSDSTAYQNALHLKEGSVTCLSNDIDPEKPQGEHQSILESVSHVPTEESTNMNCSEDFGSHIEKLAEHKDMASSSMPLEKMDNRESTLYRERDQSELDIRHSGVSQISDGPTPLSILPELVVEQVPNVSSSSSSPKSDIHKILSVEQVSSSSFDPEMHLKVQKSDEEIVGINLLDKPLPENFNPPAPQNAQHLSLDSTSYPSYDKDLEELQEPCNPLKNATQELNSIHTVKVPEVIANNDMRNLKAIDDINNEAHISPREENAGVLSNMSDESEAKSIDVVFIGGQTVIESKGENAKVAETAETSNPVDYISTLETNQERGQEIVEVEIPEVSPSTGLIVPVMLVGTAESGLSQIHQSLFSDSNPSDLLPEVVVEQVPMASSSSSSPNSVLQTKFSIDQGSVMSLESLDQDIHVEAQQSETEMQENALTNGLRPENLTAVVPQNYLTEDSIAHQSDNKYSGDLQELSNSHGMSTEEESVNYRNDSERNEKEEKLSSTSVDDGEAQPNLLTNKDALIDAAELSDVTSIECPGGGLKQITDNGAVIGTSKPIEQSENSGTAKSIEEFGEPMKSRAEASEVVEGKVTNANVVGLSKPVEHDCDSSITEEREELSKDDLGNMPFEEPNIISDVNESVVNVMRSEDVAEQQKNAEVADSSSPESDEGKFNKLSEAEAMVGLLQPPGKKDNLNNNEDTEETTNLMDHDNDIGLSRSDHSNGRLDHFESSKGETKELIRDYV